VTSCISCGLEINDKAICLECYNELLYERDQLTGEVDMLQRRISDLESQIDDLQFNLECAKEERDHWKGRYHRLLADAFMGD